MLGAGATGRSSSARPIDASSQSSAEVGLYQVKDGAATLQIYPVAQSKPGAVALPDVAESAEDAARRRRAGDRRRSRPRSGARRSPSSR